MHHPKSWRSKGVRSALIPAAALCVGLSACADLQSTGPGLQSTGSKLQPASPDFPGVSRTTTVPFNKYFTAWSQRYSDSPIQTQMFALDGRQDRQFSGFYPDPSVMDFARANPGRLYIHGDEPDQWCFDPYEYAGMYHAFVQQVRTADPTARVSPAGFAEPNGRCCPEESMAPCWVLKHSISYAEQFWDAYIRRFGAPPRVDEWRFHDFGITFGTGDMAGWWARVDRLAAWSVLHGANMVLGGWGFHGWREPLPDFQEHMKQAIGLISNDGRINGAVYWSYEPWIESPRPLVNEEGSLTAEGQTHANPLTDIPTSLKVVASTSGLAKVRWNNTTSAWGAQAEFWVKPAGSSSFVYHKTEQVADPGASQTPFVVVNAGDSVKARVRYYNAFGQAGWSAFSNAAPLAASEANQSTGFQKRPHLCFLRSSC